MNTIIDKFAGLAAIGLGIATSGAGRLLGGLVLATALLAGIHVGVHHLVMDQAATSAQVAQLAR